MKSELEKEKEMKLCFLKNYKNTEEKLKLLEQKHNGNLANIRTDAHKNYRNCKYFPFLELIAEKPKYIKHITLLEQQLHSLKLSNAELQNAKNAIEKRLTESLCTVRESTQRETDALTKVQELLNITDLAIAEKNATLLREKDVRGKAEKHRPFKRNNIFFYEHRGL